MSQRSLGTLTTRFVVLLFCLSTVWYSVAHAQTSENISELTKHSAALVKQARYTEVLPLLEKLVVAEPNNAETQYYLASALLGQVANTKDEAARKALRIRARNAFIRSKELGITQPNIDAMIQSLPVDGVDPAAFSQNNGANALMVEAEAFFSQGKMDEALKKYQMALEIDPKLYLAALFSADVYMFKVEFTQAGIWYQKAIEIDPNKETAYRYSATPLMKQGKTAEARDQYIEAFITEPYNKFTVAGLIQWAEATNTNIGHPQIDIPGKDDGSSAWIFYDVTRTTWHKEKFANTFPSEKTYRHSLAEETYALRSVITLAASDKKVKTLSPSLAKLKKLNDEGLLEAYILLARADAGIARDHPAYLKQNRDKLRRYMVEYVCTGGGN